jgi:WhiB family redox-sensing transcriptional regulator
MARSSLPRPLTQQWAWQLHAACRTLDPSLFFHPDGNEDTHAANECSRPKPSASAAQSFHSAGTTP